MVWLHMYHLPTKSPICLKQHAFLLCKKLLFQMAQASLDNAYIFGFDWRIPWIYVLKIAQIFFYEDVVGFFSNIAVYSLS